MKWLPVLLVAGCASTTGVASDDREPAAARHPAAAPCWTFRDAELACERVCESIEPALRACGSAGASGRIDVHWWWDGASTEVELTRDGEHLERPARCVREVFERFVPCTDESPSDGVVPLRFGP